MSPTASPPIAAPPASQALDDPALREKLLRHAQVRLRDDHAAEDAVQETLARAVKNQAKFDPSIRPLAAWVFGVLNNVLAENYRTARKQPPTNFTDWENLRSQMDPANDPSVLATLLEGLPELNRQIVRLHHIEELSHQEIAAKLGISVGNSRVKLARAMKELQQLAAKEGAR